MCSREEIASPSYACRHTLPQREKGSIPKCDRMPHKERSPPKRGSREAPRYEADRQTRLNTSVPFVPPKPKPFDMATSIFFSRAVFGT